VVSEICMWTDRQTNIHAHHNTPLPCLGQSNERSQFETRMVKTGAMNKRVTDMGE